MLSKITRGTGSSSTWVRLFGAVVAAGTAGLSAAPARADDFRDDRDRAGFHVDVDLENGRARVVDRQHHGPRFEERRVKVWVEPVYRTVSDRVWVEAVFKTECDRIWREPVVNFEFKRVWVPDRYELRTFTRRDRYGRTVRVRQKVLVERGHHEKRREQVVVSPGRWEEVERKVMVSPGRWDTVEKKELVSAGRWEWRTERVKVSDGGYRDKTIVGVKVD